jgi:hypothetical protein
MAQKQSIKNVQGNKTDILHRQHSTKNRGIYEPAKIWESMKKIIFDNCPVNKTKLALNVNEEIVTDEATIANEFNLYFTTAVASLYPQQYNEEDNHFYETTTYLRTNHTRRS